MIQSVSTVNQSFEKKRGLTFYHRLLDTKEDADGLLFIGFGVRVRLIT